MKLHLPEKTSEFRSQLLSHRSEWDSHPLFLYNKSALACVAAVTTIVSWVTDVSTERHNKEYHVLLFGAWVSVCSKEPTLGSSV